MKRLVSLLLGICLFGSCANAEEMSGNFWNSVGNWFGQAADDVGKWASQAWDDVSAWTGQAWDDSSKFVSQAWKDSSEWASISWDSFIVWVNTLASGNPYTWLNDVILDNGIYAYDHYANTRSFLAHDPTLEEIRQKYMDDLTELSLLNEDKDILWDTLQRWSDDQKLSVDRIAKIALPFLDRLVIEGEPAIGEEAEFSGPVVTQYLLTILETMNLDSDGTADMKLKILRASMDNLTRPIIIGDKEQNVLITDDHYYIENFTYADGKYKVILTAFMKDDHSEFPLMRGETLDSITNKYFRNAVLNDITEVHFDNANKALEMPFSFIYAETLIQGKSIVIWTEKCIYQLFTVTEQGWEDTEFDAWFNSISLAGDNTISFAVDMESDGAFFGINQTSQKYTINRIFDEEKFIVPKTGHGWAAERGNNLIDNIKGVFRREHHTVIGDNNTKNGADRLITYADGSKLMIQTKYYKTASQGINACFENGSFRYLDAEGKPMAIEVPADQYNAAVKAMQNRIQNGEVPGVSDIAEAEKIVRKGNLTYDQARHIAQAGTVESILYDATHGCVTAATSMGISAATSFAINLWNGESFEAAIKESLLQGLKSGGTSFIISVLSSQLSKTGLNTAMIPASRVIVHALGPKASAVIVNAFRPAGSAIYGAAAMQSAAKLLRGNVITSTVTFVVLSAGDVADIIQGRISWKQLAKNVSTTAVGITGGTLGYIGGAALGTAILPGAGTVVGLIIGAAAGWGANEGAKALADLIAEDDADEMLRIIESQFAEIASEYFLNEEEVNQSVENLQGLITAEMLKQMFQYRNHEAFARQLIEMAIDPVVAERPFIELPSEEEYSNYLTETLEAIYEDLGSEGTPE